jgi:hypothetical protein
MADGDIQLERFPLVVHDDYPIKMIMMMTIFPVTLIVTIASIIGMCSFQDLETGPGNTAAPTITGWGFIW